MTVLGLPQGAGAPSVLEAFLNINNAFNVGATGTPSGAAIPTVPADGFLAEGDGLVLEQYRYDTTSWSLFGQFDINFTDRLTLTLGGRYTEEDKDLVSDINIDDPISALSFAQLGQDLRFIDPTNPTATCDPAGLAAVGGDACAFLVPALLLEQLAANPGLAPDLVALGFISPSFDPTDPAQVNARLFTPLTAEQASNPALNPLLPFSVLQNFPPVPPRDPESRSDDNFSWSAILSYDVTPTFNVYASYNTGFKPGGFNLNANAAFTGAFEFEEETARSIEIGAKGSLFSGAFNYSLALFDQEIEDFQSENFVGNGFALDNAGSIEVRGLEFESRFTPTEQLLFTLNFTYLFDNQYGDFKFAPCPDRNVDGTSVGGDDPLFALCQPGQERTNDFGITGLFNDLSGQDRGGAEFLGTVSGVYTFDLAGDLEGFIRGEAQHTDDFAHTTSLDPRPFANQDAFTLYHASVAVGADDGSWQVQFWGRNLTDEEYSIGGFPSVGLLGASYNIYPGTPRTYGVTLRVSY